MAYRLLATYFAASLGIFLAPGVLGQQAVVAQNLCEKMSDLQCTKIIRGLREWSELEQNSVKVLNWKYVGSATFVKRQDIFNSITDYRLARFPITDDEGNISSTVSLGEAADQLNVSTDSIGAWMNEIQTLLENLEHIVEITWEDNNGGFSSTALILRDYPYVYDNMLSNITIYETLNSCVHEKAYWIWGSLRGEIFIDLIADCSHGLPMCLHSAEGWMSFGSKQMEVEGPKLLANNHCEMTAAWGFATPLSTFTLAKSPLRFEITGIGSSKSGRKDCIESCR